MHTHNFGAERKAARHIFYGLCCACVSNFDLIKYVILSVYVAAVVARDHHMWSVLATKWVGNTLPCNMALWQSNAILYLVQIGLCSDIVSTNLFTGKENGNVYSA